MQVSRNQHRQAALRFLLQEHSWRKCSRQTPICCVDIMPVCHDSGCLGCISSGLGKKTAHLGSIVIKPHSHKQVAWRCDACPDGHPHHWTATVYSRTRGSGCPQCSSRKVCKHNCLATVAPWAAAQWDYEANAALGTPETVVAHSNQPAGWHGQVCGHIWTASPNNRIQQQSGCPNVPPEGQSPHIQPLQSVATRCWKSGPTSAMKPAATVPTTQD